VRDIAMAKKVALIDSKIEKSLKNILASSMTFYKLKNAKNINIQIEGKIKVKALLHSKTIEVSEKKNINL